jgi:phage terminase large subunit
MARELIIDYVPRTQFIPFHQRSQRWACLVVHRRGGKTVACVNDVGAHAIYTQKQQARYAYIAPFYRQAKDVAWNYLKFFLKPAITKIRESELRVELINGSWITLYGADNPDSLRGIYLDGVVLDEFGDSRPSLWGQVILPTLVDREGWAVFIGTPKGKNHFWKIYNRSRNEPGWFNLTLRASQSGIIKPEELAELRAQMDEDEYLQEMECSFEAAVKGTYYTDLLNKLEAKGQISDDVKYDPAHPVYVAFDLGYSDSTAAWFWQLRPDGIAMIDYMEENGKPLQFYFNMLRSKPYKYHTIYLPHDAKAYTLQTGRSTVEQFLAEEFPIEIAPKLDIQHGIDAARMLIPNVWFNSAKCADGIEALRAYRRKFDELTNSFSNKPLHDWASNGSDAFRIFSVVTKASRGHKEDDPRVIQVVRNRPMTLDNLFKDNERRTGRIMRI